MQKKKSAYFLPFIVGLFYFFLYLPIVVLIIFSFNEDPFVFYWKGFSFKWYMKLFQAGEVWDAFKNSLIVAVTSTSLSIVMGTLLVVYGAKRQLANLQSLFYSILAMPEIVLAVSMLSFFSFMGVSLGFSTLIAGHTLLGLGYIVPIIYIRFNELDKRLVEAAYDLGATPEQVIYTIIIPLLRPAIFSSGLLAFVISLDDFVFSFFCAGGTAQTLPIYIFAMIKTGVSPVIAALSSVLLVLSSAIVMMAALLQIKRIGKGATR